MLEDWLRDCAGLSGERLTEALSQCEKEGISSVADLREIWEADDLESVISFRVSRAKIVNALKREWGVKHPSNVEMDSQPVSIVNKEAKQAEKDGSILPNNTKYHFLYVHCFSLLFVLKFHVTSASHRKNHSKNG